MLANAVPASCHAHRVQACMPCSTSQESTWFQAGKPLVKLPLQCQPLCCLRQEGNASTTAICSCSATGRHCSKSSCQSRQTFTLLLPRRLAQLSPRATTDTEAGKEEEIQIEGIDRAYCDEFVCTSSPQVEQNVKALARDVTRLTTWTSGLFRKDVEYKDAFISSKGVKKHQRLLFPRDCMKNPKVLVTKLKMLDKGRCQVDWRLRGSIAIFPIDVDFASEFGLDLITGRVNSHFEKWDTSRLSLPSKLAFSASRIAWSLKIRGENTKEDSSGLLEKWRPSNEDQGNITQDVNDPTKFFQDDNDPSKDLFAIGAIIAFIYFIFQAYTEISKLK